MSASGWRQLAQVWLSALAVARSPGAMAAPKSSPLTDDDPHSITSRNGLFFAVPGPKGRSTVAFRRLGAHGTERLWEMPTWSIWRYLSDDGEYLVKCYEGDVHRTRRPDEVMMSIYRRGALLASVRIDQIISAIGHAGPLPDESHPWDLCKGFVSLHRFALETVEGSHLEYDVATGALVSITRVLAPVPRPNGER